MSVVSFKPPKDVVGLLNYHLHSFGGTASYRRDVRSADAYRHQRQLEVVRLNAYINCTKLISTSETAYSITLSLSKETISSCYSSYSIKCYNHCRMMYRPTDIDDGIKIVPLSFAKNEQTYCIQWRNFRGLKQITCACAIWWVCKHKILCRHESRKLAMFAIHMLEAIKLPGITARLA